MCSNIANSFVACFAYVSLYLGVVLGICATCVLVCLLVCGLHVDGMCGMNMYFCNSSTVMLWFPNWYTQDLWTEYIPSCVAIIAMAVFFEWFRAFIRDFEKASGEKLFLVGTDADANLIPIKRHHGPDTTTRVLRAVLHGLQVCISYFLMLASMTMNSGVFASICIGAAIGFYMFGGNSKPGEDQEHCH